MIYIAGLLILLGSFILLFTFFQDMRPVSTRKTHPKTSKASSSLNSDLKKTKGFTIISENRRNFDADERIRKERKLEHEEEGNLTDQSPILERIFADDVKYAELVQEDEEVEEEIENPIQKAPQIIHISGILFLDYARKIPENLKKNYHEKWKEEAFLHFKRIGFAELEEKAGMVQFYITNQTIHKLLLDEVEQILFYKNAFTLIPQNPALPISAVSYTHL
ncbi:MAG: hypothetical protein N3A69_09335, partial [Leptospiraceae bacterium]|nr:hypothetical protein [Leptospiraceae bacterium]